MIFKKKEKVVIFGDLHFPYVHKKAYKWALDLCKAEKPTHIVQIGDLYDFYWFSKYPKKFLPFSPEQEVQRGLKQAEEFWGQVQAAAPKAKCFQILGNHDERPYKRILEKVPEFESLISLDNLFSFPGVETDFDPRSAINLSICGKKIRFQHGHLSGQGRHMLHNQMRVVVGHSHTGGVTYRGLEKEIHWELNVGFLGDAEAGPLQYGPQRRRIWTKGLGIIDELGPRFVPYGG